MINKIEEVEEAVKTIDKLKPITVFAIVMIILIGFLMWLNVSGVNAIKESNTNMGENLKLHHNSNNEVSRQVLEQLRIITILSREECASLARQSGRDEKTCYN